MITIDDVRASGFRALAFMDGEQGMARQLWECTRYPRLTLVAERVTRRGVMHRTFFVDGREVATLEEAVELLNKKEPTP